MGSAIRAGVILLAASVAGSAVWLLAFRTSPEERALREQQQRLLEQRKQLQDYVARLQERRRVAQVLVVEQGPNEDGELVSTLTFQEVDERERPITSQTFTVPSDFIYFDALVIRFDESLVAAGDPQRGKSLALFRRVFGETQPPEEGFPIDPPGTVPNRFRSSSGLSEEEQQLWRDFWMYVRHPDKAQQVGIRVAQCEAVGAPVEQGDYWVLELEGDGGLTLTRQPLPGLIQRLLRGGVPALRRALGTRGES